MARPLREGRLPRSRGVHSGAPAMRCYAMEQVERGESERPLEPVIIARCGELELISVEVSVA